MEQVHIKHATLVPQTPLQRFPSPKGKSFAMHNRYKELSFYQKKSASGTDGFDTFSDGGKYYFTYRESGEVLLYSQAFPSAADRHRGINDVKKNLEQRERYKGLVNPSGQPYLSLRGSNNQEIAISRTFGSQDEMDRVLDLIAGRTGETSVKSEADKYLPTPAYIGAEGFHRFENNGQHYFSFNDPNGKPYLRSQAYQHADSRDKGIETLSKLAQDDSKWFRGESEDGKDFFFCLKSDPNKEIARSPIHFSEKEMMEAFDWIRGKDSRIGVGSALLGGSLLSANMIRKQMGADLTSNAANRAGDSRSKSTTEIADTGNVNVSKEEFERIQKDRERLRQERIDDEMRVMEKRREEEAIRIRREKEELEMKRLREMREKEEKERLRIEREIQKTTEERKAVVVEEVEPVAFVEPEPLKTVVAERSSRGFPWWPLVALLFLVPLLFWWQGCDSTVSDNNQPPIDISNTVPVTPAEPEQEEEIAIVPQEKEEKEVAPPRCEALKDLNFRTGTIEASLAACLADPECKLPAKFQWYDTQFKTGEAHMSRTAFPSLDNIAKLMAACENVQLEIYGHISEDESDVYRGKYQDETSISLSGIRARCTFRKLESRGVSTDRMSFLGKGKTDPLISDNTQRAYTRNRRSELVLRLSN